MSWFKKRGDSKNSSDTGSVNSDNMSDRRSRCDTDPATCLEVFCNHWEQAYKIISRDVENGTKSTEDEINAVSHNFEQMVTLLATEEGEEGQGMPGPILHHLLEHEILEKFCGWCHRYHDDSGKLIQEQLRMFEHLISQSRQLLLIHKPVIRPLLNLLAYCADDNASGIEANLVLVLHQLCVSISKEAVILESVFSMNADHGPTKFLIFSLLIPYLHREGKVGQQARDALLLIMTLSVKHPYIGKYIAENSDFCPVLATGLSGLYSDLPRKITIPSEDWCQITDNDIQLRIPEMAMFLNSLEFCNAVAQVYDPDKKIAHPLVRDQLIKYIYNGFLVPVLGPALHQDITGLPTPLLDSPMFLNSREEVITATAYLDLFLRKISEPCLVKAFLTFIFIEKNDEIIILESLITRINSSSKLCLVSLSLFYTLVDLNCEDVMFDLVFKYLIPCTHVMISQRRSVKDQDIYCKSAEKFLSLRPTCCLPEIDSPKHNIGELPGIPSLTKSSNGIGGSKFFRSKKNRSKSIQTVSDPSADPTSSSYPPGTFGSKLEHFETTYLEYLHEAKVRLEKSSMACKSWQYQYDGIIPPTDCLSPDVGIVANLFNISDANGNIQDRDVTADDTCESELGTVNTKGGNLNDNSVNQSDSNVCDSSLAFSDFSLVDSAIVDKNTSAMADIVPELKTVADTKAAFATEEEFIHFLDESGSPSDKSQSVEESVKCLDSLLSGVSISISRTSTPRKDRSHVDSDFGNESEMSTVYYDCETSNVEGEDVFKSVNETSFDIIDDPTRNKTVNFTEFEVVDTQNSSCNNSVPADKTSFVDISEVDNNNVANSHKESNQMPDMDEEVSEKPDDSINIVDDHYPAQAKIEGILKEKENSDSKSAVKGDKSVRFAETTTVPDLPPQSVLGVGMTPVKQTTTPNIGPFLTALLLKLEGMMQNSLPVNLMLTGVISRLAVYKQPLLRSFLLNHNLVFQPTVKSLVQVLTAVRQKVDHYSYTVQNFETLLLRARRTLAHREGLLPERSHSLTPSPELVHNKLRTSTANDQTSKEKRHRTLSELLFRRNPNEKKSNVNVKGAKLEVLAGNKGMRYINRRPEEKREQIMESTKTRNAVYCAIVLEEFVKELAALTQEHALLLADDEWCER